MELPFRLLSVFARPGEPFTGNPLAVVQDLVGLSQDDMQALGRQFNLSETTFVRPADPADGAGVNARVRIFTPDIEMPFAGHPTLGTASVVADQQQRAEVVLAMPAGQVPVRQEEGRWVLTTARTATTRPFEAAPADLARAVGLAAADLVGDPVWMDAGVEQLIVQVRDRAIVEAAAPDVRGLLATALAHYGECPVLLWAADPEDDSRVVARFFYTGSGAVFEDPATGSASANLGAWWGAQGRTGRTHVVQQGELTGRASTLYVTPRPDGRVEVGGYVVPTGRGVLELEQRG